MLRPSLIATLALAGLALPGSAAAAAPGPAVSTAPGRVVFAADAGTLRDNVDAGGASLGVALPDGGALLFGVGRAGTSYRLFAAKVALNGALDRSFGAGGVAAVPAPASAVGELRQVLRQPDGRLLLVSVAQGTAGQVDPGRIQVTRLNADLTLDGSYGSGGTATSGVGGGGAAALQPDGAIVLTGSTGGLTAPPAPGQSPGFRWSTTRLTPSGAVDSGFGSGGIVTIAAPGTSTNGANVAVDPAGRVVVEGQSQAGQYARMVLARLTPSGAPDPSFGGGATITTPLASGGLMLVRGDGSVVLAGEAPHTTPTLPLLPAQPQFLIRYTAAGAPDTTFGGGGSVALGAAIAPQQLLPATGGGALVVGTPAYSLVPGSGPMPGHIDIRPVDASGQIDTSHGADVDLAFGGGGSSFLVSVRPRPVASVVQSTFSGTQLVRRADGSYLVPGGVHVSQPTGEGTGTSIGRFAAAALTPAFAVDPAFGGPAAPLRLSVSLKRQRAATARTRHGIRVALRSSALGLARVKVTHGGRAIAHSVLPVFTTSGRVLPVELTAYGNTYLRHHRDVHVAITATGRDLLAGTAVVRSSGVLR